MKASSKPVSVFDRILDIMAGVAGLLLMLIMVFVCAEVVTRYIFNRPLGWVTEVGSYVLLYVTFLVAAWVLRGEGHVAMDTITNLFLPKTQSLIKAVTSAVSAFVCLVLAWFGLKVSWDLLQAGYFTPTMLELPKWFLTAIIFLGSLLLAIQFIRGTYASLKNWRDS
jgi:TRAP-type C4-dicarboxylate transport system permease small subunit